MRLRAGDGVLVRLPVAEVHAAVLLHGVDHGQALPVAQIDLVTLIRHDEAAADILRDLLHHVLDKVHHAVEIRIGLIKLDGGELRVVLRVHALVAEDTADLIHAVHAADNEALEVQLRLDAEDHIHIQRVVVRIERARRRADLKRRQDRGIDLEKAAPIEEAA